ncbi:MAG TPA: hypothetical protein VK854_05755 [Woeseiaceae bacterium]|nr:hypothetical protein [Woeseiaceae bacterium]
MLIAISLPAGSLPADEVVEDRFDARGVPGIQARHTLRGQAWAAELFGRRYGRNLLAAVVHDSDAGEIRA